MKKNLLLIGLVISVDMMFAQTAALKIDTIYDNGGIILVPITLEAISNPITGNNLFSSWGWYIAYDANVLNAGVPGDPATLINLSSQFPADNYFTNIIADNPIPGFNTIAILYASAFSGMGSAGMKFFDMQFTYVGTPEGSDIYWTSTNKAIKSPKFVTNMADDEGNEFTLTLINGSVSPRITATLKISTVYDNGGTVDLPVTLDTIDNPLTGNNLISSWGWYISYDASVLNAGVTGGPATLINLSSEFPADNYLTNIIADNPTPGWNTIAIIYASAVSGMGSAGMKFFDIQFTYVGPPEGSEIYWTSTNEIIKSPKFVTNMADDEGNEFFLTLINGNVLPAPGQSLNLKVFLEGPYYSGQMTPFLNVLGHLPTSQPYNIAPWNYLGTESVTSFPSSDIVDWVLVDVLKPHTDGNQIRFEVMGRKAGFLFNDGLLKDIDGTSNLTIETIMTSGFYIRIHHRNHLSIISAVPLLESGDVFSYDFTLSAYQAFGGTLLQKQLSSIIWGMIAADANASGQIDNRDKNEVWLPQQGLTGYYEGDFNMDTQVDNDDKIVKWEPNAGKSNYAVKDTITPPTWSCGDPLDDTRDAQIYNTVQIGSQCWMAENLKIGIKIDGTDEMSNDSQIEKYCYYDDENNCNTYGGLYQWNEMMNYTTSSGAQGICPDGWHIPKDEELTTLFTFLGGTDVAGGKMKSTGTIEAGTGLWYTPNTGATNESGFSAIPGGYRFYNGTFLTLGYGETYWSSSEVESDSAFVKLLAYNVAKVWEFSDVKNEGYSVRCVNDIHLINQPPSPPSNPSPPDGALNQSVSSTLSWICTDPENDPITYDIYFGTSNPPLIAMTGQSEEAYNPGLLENNTTYYWKIVAYDIYGDSTIGATWSITTKAFQCGDLFKDDRDGQIYSSKQIDAQCWMDENLNVGTMITGGIEMSNNNQIEKYCYDNNPDSCDVYGGLYQWEEVMQYATLIPGIQGICPSGWHIPTDLEWTLLIDYLGGSNIAGGKMKETGFAHWEPPNTGATNESGFNGLPGGYYYGGYGFIAINSETQWWSSTRWYWDQLKNYNNVYKIKLRSNSTAASKNGVAQDWSETLSVRCINDETAPGFPSVTTSYIFNINQSSAIGGGNVTSQGNSSIIERGICWSITKYPMISDPHTADGEGTGTFVSQITGLNSNTTYYVRAYASDSACTAYGNMVSFVAQDNGGGGEYCPGLATVTYEGQVYNTVQIGSQCWFRENLNVGVRKNGGSNQTNNGQIEKDCYYHEPGYCDIYGGLYRWEEMMQYSTLEGAQGICPTGWHIPTGADWTTLTTYLGGANIAGGKIKEAGFAHWLLPNTGATNESGFTGLPGGHFSSVYFNSLGAYGEWWSSTFGETNGLVLDTNSSGINQIVYHSDYGYSVRCIKD